MSDQQPQPAADRGDRAAKMLNAVMFTMLGVIATALGVWVAASHAGAAAQVIEAIPMAGKIDLARVAGGAVIGGLGLKAIFAGAKMLSRFKTR